MKIWFASSEVAPFAKTGGLADVAGSLPKAIKDLGVDIKVVLPKYGAIAEEYINKMKFVDYIYVDLTWRKQYCGIFKLEYEGVEYYFIDNEFYFNRNWYYGEFDDGERFTFFCKAIIEVLPVIDFVPDIIHCNDWQTGLVSVLLEAHYKKHRFKGMLNNTKTVYTIHNLKYQGVFNKEIMDSVIGLNWDYFNKEGVEYYDAVNFMKSAIVFSNKITTVSETYAAEITKPFFGEGLNGYLLKRFSDLKGIVNGIDYDTNNPETDDRLYTNFSIDTIENKYKNKTQLQKDLKLKVKKNVPLIGIISRLVDQKGFDLIDRMISELLEMDIQIVLLGTGEHKYEEMFKWAEGAYKGKISSNIKYDAKLAQRIYAASDMFLMPSLFEPCGLSQIFSMRYGTVPIVRETGGLKDTVVPYNKYTNSGTGFSFCNYNAHEMKYAVESAVDLYKNNKKEWKQLVIRCMKQDFTWTRSAGKYVDLYKELTKKLK